jgi:uncharacterized membrane protein
MSLLITGITTWCVVHLFPSVMPGRREALIARLGNNAYRGVFALLVLGSLVAIVFGWRSATPAVIYAPPLQGGAAITLLMFVAFVLFIAAQSKTNIKRVLRHPQLTGVIVLSVAHLLANGDSRSVALFCGLGVWAVLEIVLINHRDGAWQKPDAAAATADIIVAVIATVAFAVVLYFHELLFGIAPIIR